MPLNVPPGWRGNAKYVPSHCEACGSKNSKPLTACIFLHWWTCRQCQDDWGTAETYDAKQASSPDDTPGHIFTRVCRLRRIEDQRRNSDAATAEKPGDLHGQAGKAN